MIPVYLRMALIFTDIQTGSGSQPCAILKICEYQRQAGGWNAVTGMRSCVRVCPMVVVRWSN